VIDCYSKTVIGWAVADHMPPGMLEPVEILVYGLLALAASCLGALGGLGGAILLVPALVLTGMPPATAAPLGLLCVASGSVAAAPRQLHERVVNHRLGAAIELAASAGAVTGAILSTRIPEQELVRGLAVVTLGAATVGITRSRLRNQPLPQCVPSDVGERIGRLSGAYPLGAAIVPYQTRRLRLGLAFMGLSGFVAGTTDASGGFIKTPVLTDLMHVPFRVAAATTTFTVGVTSAAALLVFIGQDRVSVELAGPIVAASLLGGLIGARVQSRLHPVVTRRGLCLLLVVIAVLLLARA
jgi:uncharacterized membrane protein YfcA